MPIERKSGLSCLTNIGMCDCPWRRLNAEQMNRIGKDRDLRKTIEREGYDRVNLGLITELLHNPNGSYYTEAFDIRLPFSPGMQQVRNFIIRGRWQYLLTLEDDPHNIRCTQLRGYIEKYKPDPAAYLAYLQRTLYESRK